MVTEITLKGVSIILGIVMTVGGVLFGMLDIYISFKLSDIMEWQSANGAKMDLLMEERMAKMERTELYNRFNAVLKSQPSDLNNYSIDRYINDNDYEPRPSSKK